MENVFVVPARDEHGNAKRVVDPQTGEPLPADGAFKPRSQYWHRRIAQGDVTETPPPAPSAIPERPSEKPRKPKSSEIKG